MPELPHTLSKNLFIKSLIFLLIDRGICEFSYCFISENLDMWSLIPISLKVELR